MGWIIEAKKGDGKSHPAKTISFVFVEKQNGKLYFQINKKKKKKSNV